MTTKRFDLTPIEPVLPGPPLTREEFRAASQRISPHPRVPDEVPVTIAAGYLNDPTIWCYWETEYADEGSVGPFASREEAAAHAVSMGYAVAEEGEAQ
jgi:hypothetical protein